MIQDLHANVGVQKNIAAVLYRLLRINKVPWLLVCVEGASGEGDVSLLRSLPQFIRHGFEAMLLHKAYLTGAELAATESAAEWEQQQTILWDRMKSWFSPSHQVGPVSLSPIRLWGVDDPDLYRKNWRAAKYVDKEHYTALQELKSTRAMLSAGAADPLRKHLNLLIKMLLLRLQPKDYQEYLQNRSMNPHGSELVRSHAQSRRRRIMKPPSSVRPPWSTICWIAWGTRRDIRFWSAEDFTRRKWQRSSESKKGIAYVVITPRVTVLDQDEAYRARLREEE